MIPAIVLAAGLSSRMGKFKPLLPFGEQSVVAHILAILTQCPIGEIIVVTGHMREQIEEHLANWSIRPVFNPAFASGEMLSSVQVGLRNVFQEADAAMIILGDQPALEQPVVEMLITAYRSGLGRIIIPSYQRRRGHPLIIDRYYWKEILALREDQTLRDFFMGVGDHIHHVEVATPAILRDMDTPTDYQRELAILMNRRQT